MKPSFSIFSDLKDHIPEDLISGVVYKFQCGLRNQSYYGENIRFLYIRFAKYKVVSSLSGKMVKPINNSAVYDHLFHFNYLPFLTTLEFWFMRIKNFY